LRRGFGGKQKQGQIAEPRKKGIMAAALTDLSYCLPASFQGSLTKEDSSSSHFSASRSVVARGEAGGGALHWGARKGRLREPLAFDVHLVRVSRVNSVYIFIWRIQPLGQGVQLLANAMPSREVQRK